MKLFLQALLLLMIAAVAANAQCGVIVANPLTGQLDCIGPASTASGTVTSVSGSGPAWLTWTIGTATTTPAISLAPTTGQTSHQVIGTCNTATTFAPCALVPGDIPTLNQSTTGNAATATALAANGTNCSAGSPPLGVDASGNSEGCAPITDAQISTSNITTNNVSTSKHGFAPILPNDATKFLDGTGSYSTPPGTTRVRGFGGNFPSAFAVNAKAYSVIPYACTISAWNVMTDATSLTFKVWKIATGTAIPTISNVINTSGLSLSTGTAVKSTTVSDFTTTTVSAYDMVAIVITAVAGSPTFAQIFVECDQ